MSILSEQLLRAGPRTQPDASFPTDVEVPKCQPMSAQLVLEFQRNSFKNLQTPETPENIASDNKQC
jgi:hypothetical protein